MKKLFLTGLMTFLFAGTVNASLIYIESFETDGLGTRYTAAGAGGAGLGCCQNWSLNSQDEGDHSDALIGFTGSDFWSGTDLDDSSLPTGFSSTTPRDLQLNALELDGISSFLTVSLAQANMDSGTDFLRIFAVNADDNSRTVLDFFDGGDAGSTSGVALTSTFQDVSYDLGSLGFTNIIVGFEAWNTSNSEAVGIDNIRVSGVAQIPEPISVALFGLGLAALRLSRKR